MAVSSTTLTNTQTEHLRPLNPRRDLARVADLIELCFSENIDPDGQRYLHRMRQAASNYENSNWMNAAFQMPTSASGFVWEEKEQIIGNISLIPFTHRGRPLYLIANVAVHPDFRRQGIARKLTTKALAWTNAHRIKNIWLQVRDNNPGANSLYQSLGFVEQARRTTWVHAPGIFDVQQPSGVRIAPQKNRHWKLQRQWLRQNYPDDLFWYWPISPANFRPGFWGLAARLLHEARLRHWAVERQGILLGLLSWDASGGYADRLWLAAPSQNEELVLQALLPYISWPGRAARPLSLDYPIGRAADTLQNAGFRPLNTLIWMKLNP